MIRITTEPSLALIKYWGKTEAGVNIPATSSIAISLKGLITTTEVTTSSKSPDTAAEDVFSLNGTIQQDPKVNAFLRHARSLYPELRELQFSFKTENTFPTSAGIASSSSGFAALAIALDRAARLQLSPAQLSSLARTGSGSASRAVFGGFTSFPAGSEHASQLFDHNHWPDLRIVVVMVSAKAKPIGSRGAMERTRTTSPYFEPWVDFSRTLEQPARNAISNCNLSALGPLIRRSYLAMFGSMLAADPGVLYWLPDSIAILQKAAVWRAEGLAVWETMDAGPQVKLVTTAKELPQLQDKLQQDFPHLPVLTASVGSGPIVTENTT